MVHVHVQTPSVTQLYDPHSLDHNGKYDAEFKLRDHNDRIQEKNRLNKL